MIIALENGYFKDEGLSVESIQYAAGKLALDALLAGAADVSTVAATPIMFAINQGYPLKIVATFMESSTAMKVIGRKDAGIRQPYDLKSKKVGLFFGTSGEFFTELFLNDIGVKKSEVVPANLRPPDMPPALIRGDIDAFFSWEPHINQARKILNDNGIIFNNPALYTFTFSAVVKPDYLAQHPKKIKKFLRALLRAEQFIKTNEEQATEIIATYSGMQLEDLKAIWNDFYFRVSLDSTVILKSLEAETRWARRSGLLSNPDTDYGIKNYFDSQYLRQLKPEAVKF